MRRVYRQAVREAAKPVRDLARQLAPEDEGELRRSIVVRSGRRSRRIISAIVAPGTRARLGIAQGSKGYYPTHVELGSKRNVPPDPYLRDAMERLRGKSEKTVGDLVGQGIDKAVQ